MPEIEGRGDASGLRVGVVVATFNEVVTAGLLQGALEALSAAGAVDPTVVRGAGAFEIPVVARALAAGGCDCAVGGGAPAHPPPPPAPPVGRVERRGRHGAAPARSTQAKGTQPGARARAVDGGGRGGGGHGRGRPGRRGGA